MWCVVTGGAGFVGSNVVARLLADIDDARVVIVDVAPFEDLASDFLSPFGDRVSYLQGDVRDPGTFADIPCADRITHVVHAAMVAQVPGGEASDPRAFLDINLGGTVTALEWARTLPSLEAFLYVSSGAVYGEPTALSPAVPQPEEGPFNPPELYAISKFAAENVSRRYGELLDLDVRAVRLSAVFGPMERPTSGRRVMSLPYHAVHAVVRDRPLLLTGRTLEAGGDFISSEDAARAIVLVLTASKTVHEVYNVAFGTFTSVRDLLSTAASLADLRFELSDDPGEADVDMDPLSTRARWNAYAIDRIGTEFGWAPRPLGAQLASYIDWVAADPQRRCP